MNAKEIKGVSFDFLTEFGFDEYQIEDAITKTSGLVCKEVAEKEELVKDNLKFLKDLGVTNFQEVFMNFAYMFLHDRSVFQGIFNKYDKEDLIQKIANNVLIVEHL